MRLRVEFILRKKCIYYFDNEEGMLDIPNSCRTVPVAGDEFVWRGEVYKIKRRRFNYPVQAIQLFLE